MMWVKWEDEDGNDLLGLDLNLQELDRVFNRDELRSFSCLKYIDSYDDSVFNWMQCEELMKELEVIEAFSSTEIERKELIELKKFISGLSPAAQKRALLKFYGE